MAAVRPVLSVTSNAIAALIAVVFATTSVFVVSGNANAAVNAELNAVPLAVE